MRRSCGGGARSGASAAPSSAVSSAIRKHFLLGLSFLRQLARIPHTPRPHSPSLSPLTLDSTLHCHAPSPLLRPTLASNSSKQAKQGTQQTTSNAGRRVDRSQHSAPRPRRPRPRRAHAPHAHAAKKRKRERASHESCSSALVGVVTGGRWGHSQPAPRPKLPAPRPQGATAPSQTSEPPHRVPDCGKPSHAHQARLPILCALPIPRARPPAPLSR
jgi:hypothetical protein